MHTVELRYAQEISAGFSEAGQSMRGLSSTISIASTGAIGNGVEDFMTSSQEEDARSIVTPAAAAAAIVPLASAPAVNDSWYETATTARVLHGGLSTGLNQLILSFL